MRIVMGIVVVVALAACGGGSTATETVPIATATMTGTLPATLPAGAVPTEGVWVTPSGEAPGPVRAAVAAAAEEADVPADQVQLVAWAAVEWESSALGCPKPGMAYLPVITPGYAVRLIVEGRELEYHTNMETTVVRCTGR